MVKQDEELSSMFTCYKSRKLIECKERFSTLGTVPSNVDAIAGWNPTTVFIDELASHGAHARTIWGHLLPSMRTRHNGLLFVISHAGTKLETLGHEQFNYCLKVQDDEIIDTTLYPKVYRIPEHLDWRAEENWPLANPSLGAHLRMRAVRSDYQETKNNPAEEARFRTYTCNQFVGSSEGWLSFDSWDKLKNKDLSLDDFEDEECIISIDAARTTDLCCVLLCFKRDGKFYVFPRFFVTSDKANNLTQRKDHIDYRACDSVDIVSDNAVDGKDLIAYVVAQYKRFNVKECVYDPSGMTIIRQVLEEHGVFMVEHHAKEMPEAIEQTYRVIMERKLQHPDDKVLNWCISNTVPVVGRHNSDRIMFKKAGDKSRIDGTICLVMGVSRMLFYTEGDQSHLLQCLL